MKGKKLSLHRNIFNEVPDGSVPISTYDAQCTKFRKLRD